MDIGRHDFEQVLRAQETVEHGASADDVSYEQYVIVTALEIAVRVMTPRLVEEAIREWLEEHPEAEGARGVAEAIRSALTKVA